MKAMGASDTPSSAPCLSTQWVDDNATQEPISEHLVLSLSIEQWSDGTSYTSF